MDDMAKIMIAIEDGVKPEEAALTWIDSNKEKVAEWTDGVPKVNGIKLTLLMLLGTASLQVII
jgi:glycine betaine/proline transport system substrate-binding protein